MSLPDVMAVALGLSLTAYAIFAGADFGAGVLDLLCGDRSAERAAAARVIGPLWEANHVWLIFSITILFSAFPPASAALGTALPAPLTLALLAIVLRGVAFGLRSSSDASQRSHRRLSRIFGGASVAAPFLFGLAAGGLAVASAASSAPPGGVLNVPWASLFAVIVGALAVALCVQLAASYMTLTLARGGARALADRFRRRGLQAGAATLLLAIVALGAANWKAPALSHRLTTVALPILLVGVVAAVISLHSLATRHYVLGRAATVTTAGALIWGWIAAQSPRLIGPGVTIHNAAATPPALIAVAIAGAVTLLLVVPALFLLFGVFTRPARR
jgi:cytochrome bd ubiquinol oxidase subunit II